MEGNCRSWTIVLSSFLIHFLESGFSDTFCIILPAVRETFQANNAEASLANSLVVFLTLGISPIAAWLAVSLGNFQMRQMKNTDLNFIILLLLTCPRSGLMIRELEQIFCKVIKDISLNIEYILNLYSVL